jgi:CheY-like chemotaxis protein
MTLAPQRAGDDSGVVDVDDLVAERTRLRDEARGILGVTGEGGPPPKFGSVLRDNGASYYPLAALGTLSIVDSLQGYAFTVLTPEISRSLGIGVGTISLLLVFKTLASALAPLPIAALVQRVAVQVVGSSPKHQLDLRLEPAWVSGDDTRLEQIVINLLSNAVRYSPDGGAIQLVLARAADRVVLMVRDEGVGIAVELLPRMFDLFVQGDRGAARSQGGLGIGLTLAHRLAELHDGRLDAHSDGEGQGSTFTLTLPGVEPLSGSEPTPLLAGTGTGTGAVRRLDVLLVEDNDDGRRMLREVLEGAGHRVTEAVDGPQALEQATAAAFDVALIDIGLPGIDGLEVARRLRRMGPRLATTLLVAITGYGAPQDHARSREAGFDLHVVKPVDGVDLLDQVQRVLLQAR